MDNHEENLSALLNETEPTPDLNADPEPDGAAETPTEDVDAGGPDEGAQAAEKAADGDEKGVTDDQGEPPSPDAEKKAEEKPQDTVPLQSLMDERKKRQEFERRLRELEAQQVKQEPAPDPIDDPEGFAAWQDRNVSQKLDLMKLNMSESILRDNVGDEAFEAAMEYFADEVGKNPALAQQLRESANPAKFAYNIGLQAKERSEIGDPKQYAAMQVEKARKEWEASLPDIISKQVQEQLSKIVPQSLADSASAAARSTQTPVDVEAEPIENLLPK